jgi:hypothetical protein
MKPSGLKKCVFSILAFGLSLFGSLFVVEGVYRLHMVDFNRPELLAE